jgi:hypothetical protein
MKIHSGTYGKETIESNSLVANLLKYPEIARTIIKQYPQFSLTYFVDGTSRFAKEEMIGDIAFRWAIQGRLNRPSTLTGVFTGGATPGLNFATFQVETEENYFNPNDVVRFKDGSQAIVIGEPVVSVNGYTFNMKLQTNSAAAFVNPTALVAGATAGKLGTAFTESSERGYETHIYPDWYVNYLSINRKAKSISGSAATDVLWIESGGQKLWFFKDQMDQQEEFMYELEKDSWYSRSTVDGNGNPVVFDANGKPIIKGDGIIKQIDSANLDTYTGDLTEKRLTDFLAQLALNTGTKGNQWMVFTGTAGMVAFHEAMKNLVYPSGNLVYDAAVGKETEIGVNFTTYNALGHKLTLVHNPLFDDANLHGGDIDPATGYLKESFRMVFLNMGTTNGISNIERKVKGAGNINRSMIIKYIPGMINPFDQKAMLAASSRDSFTCEWLSESGIIVRNPLSCGQLLKA